MIGTNQADKRYQVLEIDRTVGAIDPNDEEPATAGLVVNHNSKIYSVAEIDEFQKSINAERVVPLFYGIAGAKTVPPPTGPSMQHLTGPSHVFHRLHPVHECLPHCSDHEACGCRPDRRTLRLPRRVDHDPSGYRPRLG